MSFESDTQVSPAEAGGYDAVIHDGWDIGGNANGGYLLAMAVRAMLAASERDDPLTVTAHYLRPGRPGPAHVDTEVVKAGKSFTTVRAAMAGSDGRLLMSLLGTFGGHDLDGPEFVDGAPPELPGFEECARMRPTGDFPSGFGDRVDTRFAPDEGFMSGVKSGKGRLSGWFTFPELDSEAAIDPLGLMVATDAFPPVVFNLDVPAAWVPTVELTVHVRARPAPGPLRCLFTTRFVTGGFLEEESEVWDGAGRMVAQSRQLALVPRA